jgi:uncharacterized protein DUF6766
VLQALAGHADFNEDQDRHGDPHLSLGRYLVSSSFAVAVLENWQSDYLQFFLFILLTWARRAANPTRTRRMAATPGRNRRAGPERPGCGAGSTRTR